MKYNLASEAETTAALTYVTDLAAKGALVEVKKVSPRRSLNQNSYLHLLIGAFGAHFGYTLEEAKYIYKEISKDIYQYQKKGRTFMRSSADLTKEEMAKSINAFMQKSDEAGYPLPLAENTEWLMSLENAMEQAKYYL